MSEIKATPKPVRLSPGTGTIYDGEGVPLCEMPPTCWTSKMKSRAEGIVEAVNSFDYLKQRVKVLEEALDGLRAPCRRMFVPCGACVNCEITSRVIHLQKAIAPPVGEKEK